MDAIFLSLAKVHFLQCYVTGFLFLWQQLNGVMRLLCRFNGLKFLKGHKGKKIMFVGDSLSLNQFNSLACMLHASVPNSKATFRQRDALSSVTFEVCSFFHQCRKILIYFIDVRLIKSCHFLFCFFKYYSLKFFEAFPKLKTKFGTLKSDLYLSRSWYCSYLCQ